MSGVDTSIYQNLLRPPKSVAEYDAEALSNQQNRLALQMSQAQLTDRQRAIDDGNKLRQVVSGFGADKAANSNLLQQGGFLKEAQAYDKGNADVAKTNADVAHLGAQTQETHFKAVNLKLGQVKDLANTMSTPAQAALLVQGMYKDPDLAQVFAASGDTPEAAVARIPTDPAGFQKWKMQFSLGADKLIEYTTPTANTVANNNTSIANTKANNDRIASEGNANRSNAIKVQQMITDRQPEPISGTKLAPEDIATMAQQYLAGDKSVLQGLGRGAQGAEDIRAVRAEIGKQLRGSGLTGADQAAKIAEYGGLVTGLRATGNISARVENAIAEAEQLAPLAIAAGREVSRSGLLPFGKIGIMFDTNTNNPALAKFATANQGLATAYASAMARGNKPTVSDNEHARERLSTAMSQEAYEATVAQMKEEMKAAKEAPRSVRANLSAEISGKGGHGSAPPAAAPALPAGWKVEVR